MANTVGRITTTYIEGSDTIAGSRQTINDNFLLLANGINTIEQYLNTDTKTISGIESASIQKGIGSITETLLNTNGSISAGGNIVANSSIIGNIGRFKAGLTIETGDITVTSNQSNLALAGNLRLGGEFVLEDFGNSFLDAADKLSFTTNNWTNLVYNQSQTEIIAGLISVKGINSIIIDWAKWLSSQDTRYFLDAIKIGTSDLRNGHTLKIMALMGNIESHPFTILKDTLISSQELTVGVQFTKNYQFVELIFDGTNWVIVNYTPGVQLV